MNGGLHNRLVHLYQNHPTFLYSNKVPYIVDTFVRKEICTDRLIARLMEDLEVKRLRRAVLSATQSNCQHFSPDAVFCLVRSSRDAMLTAYKILMDRLQAHHARTRLMTIKLIDALFMRSAVFRQQLVQRLGIVFDCTLLKKLPSPADVHAELRETTIDIIHRWVANYGSTYQQLKIGYKFLKSTVHIQFPTNFQHSLQQHRVEQMQERTLHLLRQRCERIMTDFASISHDLEKVLREVSNAFEMLFEIPERSEDNAVEDDAVHHRNMEENLEPIINFGSTQSPAANNEELLEADANDDYLNLDAFVSTEYDTPNNIATEINNPSPSSAISALSTLPRHPPCTLVIEFNDDLRAEMENEDNTMLFDCLRDGCKQLHSHFMPLMTKWIDTLSRTKFIEAANDQTSQDERIILTRMSGKRDELLRKAIDLRNRMKAALNDCYSTGILKSDGDNMRFSRSLALCTAPQEQQHLSEKREGDYIASSLNSNSAHTVGSLLRKRSKRIARSGDNLHSPIHNAGAENEPVVSSRLARVRRETKSKVQKLFS